MTTIEPETLREQLENGEDVCVIDTRSEEDYEQGHIEGSQNRPIREAFLSGDVEEALAEVTTSRTMRTSSWFVMQVLPHGGSQSTPRPRPRRECP